MLTISPQFGKTISITAERATIIATDQKEPVTFRFNGVDVVVSPGEAAENVALRWERDIDNNVAEYRKTPEYAKAQERAAMLLAEMQSAVDTLVSRLPEYIDWGYDGVVEWVGKFAEVSDHVQIVYDRGEVIQLLENAGYVSGDCVKHPAVKTDKHIMARWLIGQAMKGISTIGSPHPIAIKFAAEYKEMA